MTALDSDYLTRLAMKPARRATTLMGMVACALMGGCGMLFSAATPAETTESTDVQLLVDSCPDRANYVVRSCPANADECPETTSGITRDAVVLKDREYTVEHFNWTAWTLGTVVDLGLVAALATWGATDPDSMPYAGLGAGALFLAVVPIDIYMAVLAHDERRTQPIRIDVDFRKHGYQPKHVTTQVPPSRPVESLIEDKLPVLEMSDAKRAEVTAAQRRDLDAAKRQGSVTAMLDHVANWPDGSLSAEAHSLLVERLRSARPEVRVHPGGEGQLPDHGDVQSAAGLHPGLLRLGEA